MKQGVAALGGRPSLVAIAVGNHPASKYFPQAWSVQSIVQLHLLWPDSKMTAALMQDIFNEEGRSSGAMWDWISTIGFSAEYNTKGLAWGAKTSRFLSLSNLLGDRGLEHWPNCPWGYSSASFTPSYVRKQVPTFHDIYEVYRRLARHSPRAEANYAYNTIQYHAIPFIR